MAKFIRFLQTLDYIRFVLGICIMVDGYPLIFFFRDALRFAPGSSTFTALCFGMGLIMMIPFTVLRRLYRPNEQLFWVGIAFLLLSITYMYVYPEPGGSDKPRELIWYAFIFIFLFLLISIPNDIIRVAIPVIVFFTLVSNLGLIYSLIKDPSWAIGQRATIVLNNSDDGSGNPHVFARNAYMGVVACAIWLMRPDTNFLFRLLSLFAGILNIIILVLTQTRSSVVALLVATALFMAINVRPAQIRTAIRGLFRPIPIIVMAAGVIGVILFFRRYGDVYSVLYGYVLNFMDRNLENIYAFLGLHAKGVDYRAALDDSVANRANNFNFLLNTFLGHAHMLIFGYGYKFSYLDVPIMEAFTDLGLAGLLLFGGINVMVLRQCIRVMYQNPNPWNTFLAYFYILVFVQVFTGGRPFEVTFWFPLALMIRFMGVEHLFPAYLMDHPEPKPIEESPFVVVANGQS
ncbi:hypothetical protein [Spirosoma koreense]